MKSYAVHHISSLIIVPPMIEFLISKHVSHSMIAKFHRYHKPSSLRQSTLATLRHSTACTPTANVPQLPVHQL